MPTQVKHPTNITQSINSHDGESIVRFLVVKSSPMNKAVQALFVTPFAFPNLSFSILSDFYESHSERTYPL
ncbi:hypothetical protein BZG79_10785 [Salinivibrio sp. MA427]|nr:hypothetical protein BZG81_11545 [Salinivibrio sp. MA607]OOF10099.1 hypothetical protein BZG79_10785 [Salinivibrio sp. MA427]